MAVEPIHDEGQPHLSSTGKVLGMVANQEVLKRHQGVGQLFSNHPPADRNLITSHYAQK